MSLSSAQDPCCGLDGLDAWDTMVVYRDVAQCVGTVLGLAETVLERSFLRRAA